MTGRRDTLYATQRNCSMKNGFTPGIVMIGCGQPKTVREDMFMKRLSILAAGLLMGAAALQFSGVASGQPRFGPETDTFQ